MRDDIATDEGFSLGDLLQARSRLALQALGSLKHGDVPQDRRSPDALVC